MHIGVWSPPPATIAMTNNETPAPLRAMASSTTPTFDPYLAFDNQAGTGWAAAAMPASLTLDLGGYYRVTGVTMLRQFLDNQSPKDFTIETSGDNRSWVVQRTITGEAYGTVQLNYPFPASVIARFIKINITALNGAAPSVPVILQVGVY